MVIKKAIKYMIISTMSFACMNVIVKHLTEINAHQIVFFRSFSTLIITTTYLWSNKISFFGNNKKLLILRGVVGVTSMTCFFMSIKYLPIGTAVSLRYLAPIFAAIFAVFFLREKIKSIQWLFFIIAFIGVLIIKGFDSQVNTVGLMLVLIAAVFSGLVYMIISKIGTSEHPVVVVNYFMIIATIVGGVLSINNWINPKGMEWVFLISLGFFGYFGQINMTKAFQLASTNQVAPLKYMEVIFSLLFGVFLFGEIYTFWSLLGIALIIGALISNIVFKSRNERKIKP